MFLIVSKLDRLSRSMLDFASLMQKATREHWGLVALDLGVDTSTPAGEAMAHVLATFAQLRAPPHWPAHQGGNGPRSEGREPSSVGIGRSQPTCGHGSLPNKSQDDRSRQ